MDTREQTFLSALSSWEHLEEQRILAAEEYREAHGRAFSAPEKATDAGRKAAADAATSALRMKRDFAEMKATAAHHRCVFYRGSAGERQP